MPSLKTKKYSTVKTTGSEYGEIYQSSGVRFAVVLKEKGELKQITPLFKCRDFFSDAFFCVKKKDRGSIYGFSYDPKRDFTKGSFRFLVEYTQGKLTDKYISEAINLVRNVESYAKIRKVRVYRTDKKHIFLVDSAKAWCSSPIMISLITFLFRQGYNIVEHKLGSTPEKLFSPESVKIVLKEGLAGEKDIFPILNSYDKVKAVLDSREDIAKKTTEIIRKSSANNLHSFHYKTGIASAADGSFERLYKGVSK